VGTQRAYVIARKPATAWRSSRAGTRVCLKPAWGATLGSWSSRL